MEGIFLGKIDLATFDPRSISLSFRTKHLDQHVEVRKELDYDRDYMLVKADDVITTNDEILKLRDEVKRLTDECNEWKVHYSTVNNELFQKGLAYGTLETAYKNEKIAGEMLLKDRDALNEKVEKLEAELTEIKTARTLREAYVSGIEKGCESLREERDRWKRRCNSVMTDISKSLAANGVEFKLKENDGEATWVFVIDIPELNEAKDKVKELEQKLAAAKYNETVWRDRKEEEEEYYHFWLHTYDRVVKQAADKGIHIDVRGTDEDCNAGLVVVDNVKAEELERQIKRLEDDNSAKAEAVVAAKDRGDYYKGESDAIARNYCNLKKGQEKKWSAMTEALKDKGVEVIYMGEEDSKPIIDVKIPEIDILKKELEVLKSRTLDNVEIRLSCGDIVWTYCDGFVHVSSMFDGVISADQITNGHINCLCKNYFDAESISHGTIPKCKSCAHYVSGSRSADVWCHKPVSKEGPGTVRRLSTEEAEGPACSDFKARKEWMQNDS